MRQNKIEINALAHERRDIVKAAKILHMTVNKFVRDAVIKRTNAIIGQQDDIVLSDKDKKIFLRALDAPAKPIFFRILLVFNSPASFLSPAKSPQALLTIF